MKAMRHAMILQLIDGMEIDTQEMLADQLLARGVSVTQATISRDIKELRLVKVLTDHGTYKYSTADRVEKNVSDRMIRLFSESVVSLTEAENLIVIKTLPDNRLSGAAIVGTGVPQLSPPLDALREIYEARYHSGYAYAYQYPGLARVYQAAGRVIRSESDRGAVLLIDARWADRDHRALLPPHWLVRDVRDEADMAAALKAFWTVQEEKKHDLQGD